MSYPEYLVRPEDYMVFQLIGDVYQTLAGPTDRLGKRAKPYDHFTYENLKRLHFFEISKDQIDKYNKLSDEYYRSFKQYLYG